MSEQKSDTKTNESPLLITVIYAKRRTSCNLFFPLRTAKYSVDDFRKYADLLLYRCNNNNNNNNNNDGTIDDMESYLSGYEYEHRYIVGENCRVFRGSRELVFPVNTMAFVFDFSS